MCNIQMNCTAMRVNIDFQKSSPMIMIKTSVIFVLSISSYSSNGSYLLPLLSEVLELFDAASVSGDLLRVVVVCRDVPAILTDIFRKKAALMSYR